jgi:nucleoside 2-deoxyribosyltransferase
MKQGKKKVYFSGSIRGGREDLEAYQMIIRLLQVKYDVLTQHVGVTDLTKLEATQSDKDIYEQDKRFLDQCDFLVAECTTPSLGVGYELAYAEAHHKPVVVLFDITKNRKLSSMVAGNDNFRKIYYSSADELTEIVKSL